MSELYDVEGNYPHIAENGGEFENTDQLVLKAFEMGAGYEIFEVITTDDSRLADWTLRGVWNPDWSKKPHTDRVCDANGIYKKAYVDIVLSERENFLAFNLVTNGGMEKLTEKKSTEHCTVKWSTEARGIAFAIERDGYLTLASTKDDVFELGGAKYGSVEKGYYSYGGNWVRSGSAKLSGGKLNAAGGTVYRIKLS